MKKKRSSVKQKPDTASKLPAESASKFQPASSAPASADKTGRSPPVRSNKPPPVVVKKIPITKLRPELQARGLTPEFRLSGIGTSIIARTQAERDGVIAYLTKRKAEYFTYAAKDQRPFKAVLRGLPAMPLDEIVEELRSRYQLDVTEAFEIKRRAEGIHTRLYLVHFKRGTCSLA